MEHFEFVLATELVVLRHLHLVAVVAHAVVLYFATNMFAVNAWKIVVVIDHSKVTTNKVHIHLYRLRFVWEPVVELVVVFRTSLHPIHFGFG